MTLQTLHWNVSGSSACDTLADGPTRYDQIVAGSGWSLERVVSELQQLQAEGEVITYAALRAAGFGALLSAAERYAGSFSRAIQLAGIEPVRPLWTRDRVLAEVKRLHHEGVELNSQQLTNNDHAGLVQAARRHFGSWPDAVVAGGAPPFKRGRWKTWPQIRDRLRELHRRGMRMTIAAVEAEGLADLVDAAQAEAKASSWNEALAKAKVPLVQEHLAWSAEQVLDGIRTLHRDGVALNANLVIARGDRKLVKAATAYFGTWQDACRAAVPSYAPLVERWTEERLLGEIRDRHRAGLPVRSTEVAKEAPTLTESARRLGIPWRDACLRAGVPKSAIAPWQPPTKVRWDEEKIFAELENAVRAGRPLLTRSFRGSFVTAVLRRYGSWSAAMAAAGWGRQYARDHEAALANRLGGATLRTKRA
jgi:hypothetical protein